MLYFTTGHDLAEAEANEINYFQICFSISVYSRLKIKFIVGKYNLNGSNGPFSTLSLCVNLEAEC